MIDLQGQPSCCSMAMAAACTDVSWPMSRDAALEPRPGHTTSPALYLCSLPSV